MSPIIQASNVVLLKECVHQLLGLSQWVEGGPVLGRVVLHLGLLFVTQNSSWGLVQLQKSANLPIAVLEGTRGL